MIAKLGSITISLLQELSSLVWMGRETISEIGDRIATKRAPFRLEDFFYQCNRVGVGSVPMVILLSVFVGLTLALLTGYQLQIFGLVTLVPPVVPVVCEARVLFIGNDAGEIVFPDSLPSAGRPA